MSATINLRNVAFTQNGTESAKEVVFRLRAKWAAQDAKANRPETQEESK